MRVMSEARFAGVDWASEEHAVCVVDERGRIVEGWRFRHNEPGIRALCARCDRASVDPGARARRHAALEHPLRTDALLLRLVTLARQPPRATVAEYREREAHLATARRDADEAATADRDAREGSPR